MENSEEIENYKYFQNKKCEYYPCHSMKDVEDFNCLFCYCPLYMLKDRCGGNFTYSNSYKDCSNCTLPHSKKSGHSFVMSKMEKVCEIGSQRENKQREVSE